jgi:hypothetical protein
MTKKYKAAKKSVRKSMGRAERSKRAASSTTTRARKPADRRLTAFAEAPQTVGESERDLQMLLNLLCDKEELVEAKLEALETLQAATFSAPTFESWRGDYIAALRKAAQDQDQELRNRAFGILAREKDGFAQKKLLDGLQHPENAFVPPEKALQLLSYDLHAEAYPVARKIIINPPNAVAKREALRLLAADATSAPLFEKIMRDKDETHEIRQVAAAALQAIKPEKLQACAREVLLDPSEHDDIKATSLTALTQFGDPEKVAKDKALRKHVDRLRSAASRNVKQSARRFLNKYKAVP